MATNERLCERCKGPIEPERAEVLPDTRLCLACYKQAGGEFDLVVEHERTSKTGSLKKNYGGVTVRKRRRTPED